MKCGVVVSIEYGIAYVAGLENVQAGEIIEFSKGMTGMALIMDDDSVGVVIFCQDEDVKVGEMATGTGDICAT